MNAFKELKDSEFSRAMHEIRTSCASLFAPQGV
nr:MAG TPA_asm: hypothetical protein [Caudoviricetes sp.]